MPSLLPDAVLVLIDLQQGFGDPFWGRSGNPGCETNCERLSRAWLAAGKPVVVVRHDSPKPGSPLAPGTPGNALLEWVPDDTADLLVIKQVNSAFYGTPDLDAWLRAAHARQLVICGIQTNMCVETTARMAGNLSYDVLVPLDATRTFDLPRWAPDGSRDAVLSAEDLMLATATSLHHGGFAHVTTTDLVLSAL
ncbi:MAG: cysteine hydrolase family protein [Propionicimonas sp.]|nr:cysteine hydrolase family protein [Propionicimonas sp.]